MSTQYLLTPVLLYKVSHRIDDPYWCSGHMVQGPKVQRSTQYVLTPLLESCQTWYGGYPYRVDVLYWFSGQTVKIKLLVLKTKCIEYRVDVPYWFSGQAIKGQC